MDPTKPIPEEVPYCGTCRHHHFQGVACSICGHVGKGNTIFKKMKDKAAKFQKFRVNTFGTGLPNGCDVGSSNLDQWAIIRDLRGNLCEERDIGTEFNIQEERNSRHMLGWVADRPIWIARYSVIWNESGDIACTLSRFGIFPTHEGMLKQCVQSLVQDIKTVISSLRSTPESTHAAPQAANAAQLCAFSILIPAQKFDAVVAVLIDNYDFKDNGALVLEERAFQHLHFQSLSAMKDS